MIQSSNEQLDFKQIYFIIAIFIIYFILVRLYLDIKQIKGLLNYNYF